VLAQRLFACLVGSATILVIGLTVRKLAGPIAGIFAAALAAVYPNLVVLDGLLLVESIYGLTIAAILLGTYRLLDEPSVTSAAVLGALFGLAALQRTDSLSLLLILFFPLLWKMRGSEMGPLKIAAMSVLCTLFVVVPWSIYATSTSATLVPIATNARESLVNDNCSETWFGPNAGYWSNRCNELPPAEKGLGFVVRNAESFPRLALQRIGRTFDFYEPAQNARFAALIDGRSPDLTLLGRVVWWMSLPLAIFGAFQCRRLKIWLWPLLGPIFLSIGLSVISHGETRFRVAAEIAIIMLAGIGIAQIGRRTSTDDGQPL
jgi:4-amino-4-deoxy-L-arabinose transferase-like glycosyltransferase